jgi:hypothetical protein
MQKGDEKMKLLLVILPILAVVAGLLMNRSLHL